MEKKNISENYPFTSQYANVNESKLHYIEQGSGDPILFLHGVPASSYVWRNVIPHLSTMGRCIAVDLMGFGKSDKPDIEYSITDHIRYIEAFIQALNLKNITLVMHGWGSIIGLEYAMHHQENCKGLVFYESYISPLKQENISLPVREQLYLSNHSALDIIKNPTLFIDTTLSLNSTRQLSAVELEQYRMPFSANNSGKPLKKYLEELPEGHNVTNQIIENYSILLQKSHLPKLMIYSVPGFITTIANIIWAKEHLTNLEVIDVGEGLHFAQENDPVLIGESISIWLQGVEQLQTQRDS